jgi:NADH dehydrogenase (ubiquinone) 1 alpha/beta subcomplex 1
MHCAALALPPANTYQTYHSLPCESEFVYFALNCTKISCNFHSCSSFFVNLTLANPTYCTQIQNMFSSASRFALRAASRSAVRTQQPNLVRHFAASVSLHFSISIHLSACSFSLFSQTQQTFIDAGEVTDRIVTVVKNFDKVDPAKVTPQAKFSDDLGLDSLDSVEVVMAIEDEFAIEIPDAEADKITSIEDATEYIAGHPMAK